MKYTLMHKRKEVLQLDIDEATGNILSIGNLQNAAHIPIGIPIIKGVPDRAELNRWWTGRSIPASRSGIREALESMKIASTQLLLTKCLGLSLSDHYWLNPKNSGLLWDNINFFENSFSEDVGNALFGGAVKKEELDLMSPDNTSDGWLKKKWIIADGKRKLVKGGSNPFQQEPLNEVLASEIMRRLNIPHIDYEVFWENNLPYSICDDFITPDTELVSAWSIYRTQKKENHISIYQHYLNCCEKLGIPDVRNSLDKMLALDYIIANTDRHMNNFGAVRNPDTLEWIGCAPVFDSGTSLFFDRVEPNKAVESKPFKNRHDDQINFITSFDWLDFDALAGIGNWFKNTVKDSPYINELRRTALGEALDLRIESLQALALKQITAFEQSPEQGEEPEPQMY